MRTEIDGHAVFYGTGSGRPAADAEPIVFVHGAGFDHSVWVMPARYFARHGFQVVAPDLPAHGRSAGPPLTSIPAMADWIASLIDTVCDRPAVVIGHSMGSLVTLALAHAHRERVARIVLLGTSLPMPVGPPLLKAAGDNHHAAIEMANTWSHSARGALGSAQNPGLSNLVSGERWLERMADGVYHADLAACNAYVDQTVVDDVEALVIAGAADRMTPLRAGQAVAKLLSRSTTVVLEDCGHSMLSERPNEVLDALASFVMSGSGE